METIEKEVEITFSHLVIALLPIISQETIPITEVLLDSIFLNAYKKILKGLILASWSSEKQRETYTRIVYKKIQDMVFKLENAKEKPREAILSCVEVQMKARSLLMKYPFLPRYSPEEIKTLESIIESLVEMGKYRTNKAAEYEVAYNPVLRGLKLGDLRAPNEREFILRYNEQKREMVLPNRIYVKVKSNLLHIASAISDCDIQRLFISCICLSIVYRSIFIIPINYRIILTIIKKKKDMPPKGSKRKSKDIEQVPGQTSLAKYSSSSKKPKDDKPKEEVPIKADKEEVKEEAKQIPLQPTGPEQGKGEAFPSYKDWLNDLGDWQEPLKDFLATGKLEKIHKAVQAEYKAGAIFPPANYIFNAFKKTPFANVKAVIVGQDPYIKPGEAMGLSFSVPKTIKVPGSLQNIYKALENDSEVNFKKPSPPHGDLTKWAVQGVLLLNAVLTVKPGKSNSHKGLGWESFTDAVIQAIGRKKTGVVFLLWGKFAQAKKKFVDTVKHRVLEYCHPSPLAASSGGDFKKCPHFSQTNKYLKEQGKGPIDWNVDQFAENFTIITLNLCVCLYRSLIYYINKQTRSYIKYGSKGIKVQRTQVT
eukprot:TRINITY_DN120353_c1_g1_i1.p1 TRINITY_DN120353_c1_g1~~TRINITY_DN120353_c1_g1_i1.p1  ORF type:complete len:593 (+),score=63.51 TRINITY_DN120353_c1_g1_i1:5864-7642(+)